MLTDLCYQSYMFLLHNIQMTIKSRLQIRGDGVDVKLVQIFGHVYIEIQLKLFCGFSCETVYL